MKLHSIEFYVLQCNFFCFCLKFTSQLCAHDISRCAIGHDTSKADRKLWVRKRICLSTTAIASREIFLIRIRNNDLGLSSRNAVETTKSGVFVWVCACSLWRLRCGEMNSKLNGFKIIFIKWLNRLHKSHRRCNGSGNLSFHVFS